MRTGSKVAAAQAATTGGSGSRSGSNERRTLDDKDLVLVRLVMAFKHKWDQGWQQKRCATEKRSFC